MFLFLILFIYKIMHLLCIDCIYTKYSDKPEQTV